MTQPSLLARLDRRLCGLLAVFVALGAAYSIATPIFETPDEALHLAVIRHIAQPKANFGDAALPGKKNAFIHWPDQAFPYHGATLTSTLGLVPGAIDLLGVVRRRVAAGVRWLLSQGLQGRLIFPGLPPAIILFACGIRLLLRRAPVQALAVMLVVPMFALAVSVIPSTVWPAYSPPPTVKVP